MTGERNPLRRCAQSDPVELIPPCRSACPVDKDIPAFLRAIARGDSAEAWRIAYRDNLFPGVLGWICPRPCERSCRCGAQGTPIPVCQLKRWVTSTHAPPADLVPAARNGGPDVAVIGAGPAGLAAAHDLALEGASVTILDRDETPGGLLTGCIPGFRLPQQVVAEDIARILSLGIRFEPGYEFRGRAQLEELSQQGCAAVVLATGAGADRPPDIANWRSTPVSWTAIEFLRCASQASPQWKGWRVIVVGGGNGAIDAARAALRAGADVEVVYRRGRGELPAFGNEIDLAESEGIRIRPWVAVTELTWEDDKLAGALTSKTQLETSELPARQARLQRVAGTERLEPCDAIIFALGQTGSIDLSEDVPNLVAMRVPHSGSASVVEAIAAGRRTARAIIDSLTTKGRWHRPRVLVPDDVAPARSLGFLPKPNGGPVHPLPPVFTRSLAAQEAERCWGCDRALVLEAEQCVLCGGCAQSCAYDVLTWRNAAENGGWQLEVKDDECPRCGDCVATCPTGALRWMLSARPNRIAAATPPRSLVDSYSNAWDGED